MVFVETPTFMRQAFEHLPDDEFRQIQTLLIARPTAGDVIHGTGVLVKSDGEDLDVVNVVA
jgi:hypothetical protein